METIKFNDDDRKQVIKYLENHFSIKLEQVGGSKRFLKDESGKLHYLIGASADWHGIPSEIFKSEETKNEDSLLIVAKRYKNKIDILIGSFAKLIRNKSYLHQNQKGDYQFNTKVIGTSLQIKEVPTLYLEKIGEIDYSVFDSEKNLIKALESLPKSKLDELRKKILSEGDT